MRKLCVIFVSAAMLMSSAPGFSAQQADTSGADEWPQVINDGNNSIKIYQPQVDRWDGYTLQAHAAVGVQNSSESSRLSYGVASLTARTIVDKESGRARLENLQVGRLNFPSEPDGGQQYLAALRSAIPPRLKSLSLDRLEAALSAGDLKKNGTVNAIKNTPPEIIFSSVPSLLVIIDGSPALSPVKGTSLSRVINTQVFLLKDTRGTFYLHVFDGYMEAAGLNRPWTVCRQVPAEVTIAEQAARSGSQADFLDEEAQEEGGTEKLSLRTGPAPRVFVSTVPAELVVTQGEPNYLPVEGTNLLYVENTDSNIFKDLNDQKTYVLVSGRWFRSSINGAWEYVPGGSLPQDFDRIPDNHAKENVKASVPGTEQAEEARIANDLPTTEKVDRTTARPNIEFDGEPQLRPVSGTPLWYVFNCAVPVMKVDENTWYTVYNGVWFEAAGARGPWVVADRVPAVIYSIPASSPLHFVTYVKIYDVTPQYVYCGYTPGYYGTVLSEDGTVVYGTGYIYTSYAGRNVWYGHAATYGFGSVLCWMPRYGWSFSFGSRWGSHHRYSSSYPYWGPYYTRRRDRHHLPAWGVNTASNAYQYGGHVPARTSSAPALYSGQVYNSRSRARISGYGQQGANMHKGALPPMSSGRPKTQRGNNETIYGTQGGAVYRYDNAVKQWQRLNHAKTRPDQKTDEQYLERERRVRESGANGGDIPPRSDRGGRERHNGAGRSHRR